MDAGTVIDGRFEIERLAGTGGMGAVYRALDRVSGEPVAVKVLRGVEESARFAREGQILAELRHPGIVRPVSSGVTGRGAPYLAMEWLDGQDLSQRLAAGPMSLDDALLVVGRAAEALAAAHAIGVVHRD